jgi:hypothetical protein
MIKEINYESVKIKNTVSNSNNEQINTRENTRRHTGTGVLILTDYLSEPHILLGQESWKTLDYSTICPGLKLPIYEEFGGGIQTRKVSLEKNAIFELREETANLLNFTKPELLKYCPYYDIPFRNDRMYRLYIVYLKNIGDYIHNFYLNINIINSNIKNGLTNDKSKNYLEMNNIKLLPLKLFYKVIKQKQNYICFNKLENDYNNNNKVGFKGILKLTEDIYINSRLIQFLNSKYNNIYGLDILNNYYNKCNIRASFKNNKNLKLKKLINNNKQFNEKYNFLLGTNSIDIYR